MTQKEKQEEISKKFLDFQTETKYGKTPLGFKQLAQKALAYANPANSKLTPSEFKIIATKEQNDYSIWELGFVLKVMESRTAKEMDMSLPEYINYLEMIEGVVKKWRSIVAPVNEELNNELKTWIGEQVKKAEQEAANKIELPLAEA